VAHALVRAASSLVSTPGGRNATASTAKLFFTRFLRPCSPGLAPGLVGFYQTDVQVPQEVPAELGISFVIIAEETSYPTVPDVCFPVALPFP